MKVLCALLFILCFLLQVKPSFGETATSIEKILSAKPDTNKVKQLSDLCWSYRFKSADSALLFGGQALKLAREIKFAKGIAQAYNDMAIIYIDKSAFRSATNYLNESMKIREQLNDQPGIAALHNKLGIIDQKQGRLKDALQHQIEALKIYRKLGSDKWIGYSLNNIAIIHQNLGDLDNALKYHQEALSYRIRLNDLEGEATSYGNMANLYALMHDTVQALVYYENAIKLSRQLNKEELVAANLSNISSLYMAQKKFGKSLDLLKESLDIRERSGDSKGISSTLSRMGTVYINTGQYREALQVLHRSLQIARKVAVVDEELSATLALAKLKVLTHQPDSSFLLMNHYIYLRDSVYESRINQQILDVQTRYETDKLEQDLYLLRQDREFANIKLQQHKTQILLLVFVFISITGAGIFLFYRHQQKQKSALNIERIKEQETRMIAVFQVQEEERRRIAKELHDGIGQTLGAIKMNYQVLSEKLDKPDLKPDFIKVQKMLDNASSEVRSISHQMLPKELEQFGLIPAIDGMLSLYFENSPIQVSFEHSGFDARIGTDVELVLFRVLQELVSNVIKHSGANLLTVQIIRLNTHVMLNVSDNGIGFDVENNQKSGIGLLNIASRIDAIKGILRFESGAGNGTTVTIRAPIS